MTLEEQITLLDQIVRKDPDTTIKDYMELVKEFDTIRGAILMPIIRQSKLNPASDEAPAKKYSERKGPKKYLRTYKFGK